jgi:hypothetical protein
MYLSVLMSYILIMNATCVKYIEMSEKWHCPILVDVKIWECHISMFSWRIIEFLSSNIIIEYFVLICHEWHINDRKWRRMKFHNLCVLFHIDIYFISSSNRLLIHTNYLYWVWIQIIILILKWSNYDWVEGNEIRNAKFQLSHIQSICNVKLWNNW